MPGARMLCLTHEGSEFLGDVEKPGSREELPVHSTGGHISQHPCSPSLYPACWDGRGLRMGLASFT